MTAAVLVRGLTHAYPAASARRRERSERSLPVLHQVDLRIADGEFVSLVGASGCGKSTILKVVAGVLEPTAGQVSIHGEDAIGRPGRAAYMPQRDLLLPWRRALDNATLGVEQDVPREQARREAGALFDQFGLTGFERAWPSQLSGGMRQRLALLRTFLLRRDVLLLDEPFGALDAITRGGMIEWLQGVLPGMPLPGAESPRRSVLFVTHDVEEALLLSDRVVVMGTRPGRVSAEVAVPFDHPRPPHLVTDPRFVALRADVLATLGSGQSKANDDHGPSPVDSG